MCACLPLRSAKRAGKRGKTARAREVRESVRVRGGRVGRQEELLSVCRAFVRERERKKERERRRGRTSLLQCFAGEREKECIAVH